MHRPNRGDEGFTLIELMVVVLIIAILIGIAIPVFLGARTRAQDRALHSELRNSLTAAKVYYTDAEDYAFTQADLLAVHANVAFVVGNNPGTGEIGFLILPNSDGITDQAAIFLGRSTSGAWFCLADEASGSATGTRYGTGSTGTDLDTLAECDGGWSS
jgi:type IV pilus assembly protein PilA